MRSSLLPLALLAGLPLLAQAPEAPKRPWSDKGSLSYVAVGGNATSSSLGFSNEYKYLWSDATFAFNAGGVQVSSTTYSRSASGPSLGSATVVNQGTTLKGTESYFANFRYDQKVSERLGWFSSAGWERNIPAGLAGLGYWWVKEDRTKFFTDAGLGYTKETLVFSPAGTDSGFGTFHLGAKLEKKLFSASVLTSELNVSDSLK